MGVSFDDLTPFTFKDNHQQNCTTKTLNQISAKPFGIITKKTLKSVVVVVGNASVESNASRMQMSLQMSCLVNPLRMPGPDADVAVGFFVTRPMDRIHP